MLVQGQGWASVSTGRAQIIWADCHQFPTWPCWWAQFKGLGGCSDAALSLLWKLSPPLQLHIWKETHALQSIKLGPLFFPFGNILEKAGYRQVEHFSQKHVSIFPDIFLTFPARKSYDNLYCNLINSNSCSILCHSVQCTIL